jgi:hypothetical protein
MFVIEVSGMLYGPFETANEAAEWATENLGAMFNEPLATYSIRPLVKP